MQESYSLSGTVFDVHEGLPFWVEHKPGMGGSCSVTTWLIARGQIGGVDVSDMVVVTIWMQSDNGASRRARRLILVEEEASPERVRWVVDAFHGRLGGPLGDLAERVGKELGFYLVPIDYRLEESRITISVPHKVRVVAAGRKIPESHPACSGGPWLRRWSGKADQVLVNVPEHELVWNLPQSRALGGAFRFGC